MKIKLLIIVLSVIIWNNGLTQNKHVITNTGLVYSPVDLKVSVGDTVVFDVGSFHPTLEVSRETWNTNGSAALQGGFDFPDGSGTVIIADSDTVYYICTAHISSGMKGIISVAQTSFVPSIISTNSGVDIFPNPVITGEDIKFVFQNKLPENLKIKFYDLTGKSINNNVNDISEFGTNTVIVDFNKINKGLYIVEITGNSFKSVVKLVVK